MEKKRMERGNISRCFSPLCTYSKQTNSAYDHIGTAVAFVKSSLIFFLSVLLFCHLLSFAKAFWTLLHPCVNLLFLWWAIVEFLVIVPCIGFMSCILF